MKQQFTEREIEKEETRLDGVVALAGYSPIPPSLLRALTLDSLRRKAQFRRRLEAIAYGPRGLARVEALRMLKRTGNK